MRLIPTVVRLASMLLAARASKLPSTATQVSEPPSIDAAMITSQVEAVITRHLTGMNLSELAERRLTVEVAKKVADLDAVIVAQQAIKTLDLADMVEKRIDSKVEGMMENIDIDSKVESAVEGMMENIDADEQVSDWCSNNLNISDDDVVEKVAEQWLDSRRIDADDVTAKAAESLSESIRESDILEQIASEWCRSNSPSEDAIVSRVAEEWCGNNELDRDALISTTAIQWANNNETISVGTVVTKAAELLVARCDVVEDSEWDRFLAVEQHRIDALVAAGEI
jgi:hypothetical protein